MTEKLDIWNRLYPTLSSIFGETIYKGWLQFLRYEEEVNGKILLSVPSRFIKDWITNRYLGQLQELWQAETDKSSFLEVITRSEDQSKNLNTSYSSKSPIYSPQPAQENLSPAPQFSNQYSNSEDSSSGSERFSFDHVTTLLDPRYTFDNFVVGKPNELAYAAARRVAESDSIHFNPLFLYGGVGLGKTHLMHSVAWHLQQFQPHRRVIYMSAEKFMYQFIRALRQKNIIPFREQFRTVDVLMIDDVQFISGKDSTQEEFFHTFNSLIEQKRQIILSADKSPSDLQGIEDRMRSRLGWGLVADIHPTTYELRVGILQNKAEQLSVSIPKEIIEFLAHKVTSNIREMEGALNRILAHATLVGGEITLDSTQHVLRDLLRANTKYITIEEIQRHVAQHYHIRVSDIHSTRRSQVVARPRQIAMYLCKILTSKSYPEIARSFGGKDHTTIIHAFKRITELQEKEPSIKDEVELLKNMLSH